MEGGVRPCVNAFKELNIVQVVWGSTIMFDSSKFLLASGYQRELTEVDCSDCHSHADQDLPNGCVF